MSTMISSMSQAIFSTIALSLRLFVKIGKNSYLTYQERKLTSTLASTVEK